MGEQNTEGTPSAEEGTNDTRSLIRETIEEFIRKEQARSEPAYKVELLDERKRREQLERRVNELVEENRRSRLAAEEAERGAAVRTELQRLGVAKIELAFKAVKDDIHRSEDGRLVAKNGQGELTLKDYLSQFVTENPELLPARIPGGSGAPAAKGPAVLSGTADLDKIRPGMSSEEAARVREEIVRIASQTLKGM
jgi:hypothetical protein